MKLNLENFKKHKSTATHTIMRNGEGHEIHIAHESISRDKAEALKKMPIKTEVVKKMSDGGQVSSAANQAPVLKEGKSKAVDISAGFNGALGAEGIKQAAHKIGYADGGDVQPDQDVPIDPANYQAAPPVDQYAPQPDMTQMGGQEQAPPEAQIADRSQVFQQPQLPPKAEVQIGKQEATASTDPSLQEKGLATEIKGYMGEAAAQGKLGRNEAKAIDNARTQEVQLQANTNLEHQRLSGMLADATKAYNEGNIDPNRVFSNMSTGRKITTTLGLLLSGIGSGITHSDNLASKFLDQEVDRDIEAQKANMGKQKNLVDFYHSQIGDLNTATQMARLSIHDMLNQDLLKQAALSKDPMAMARAQQIVGEKTAKMAPELQAMANKTAALKAAKKGGADPASLVPFLVPKERQAEVFKEVKKAQDMRADIPLLVKLYDRAAEGVGLKNLVGIKPEASQALENAYLKHLKDDVGRINETELHTASNTFPQSIDKLSPERAKARRTDFINNLYRGASAPTAKGYGIDLGNVPQVENSNLSSTEQSLLNFAKSHPNDPRSAEVIKRLGNK